MINVEENFYWNFWRISNQSNECCDNDSDLSKIECYNRKKLKDNLLSMKKLKLI